MPDEESTLTIVIALANDVQDVRADIEAALHEAASAARSQGRVFTLNVKVVEEDADFTFYPESPRILFEDICGRFNPDLIIAVFWKHFGSAPADPMSGAEEECERLGEAVARPGHPPTFIFLRNDAYTPRTREERVRRGFVEHFRSFFEPETLWWPFKSEAQRGQQSGELRKLAVRLLSSYLTPRTDQAAGKNTDDYPVPEVELPEEAWRLIKPKELSALRETLGPGSRLDPVTAEKYFNGVVPTWREAVSQSVPRRTLVEELEREMSDAAAAGRLRVTLLIGPGGEGKSTMLHQLVVDLTEKHPGVHVIWHESKHSPLDKELIQRLLSSQGSFVIASDDAEHIAEDVFKAVEFLHRQPRQNIQFLLAGRSTDWEWGNAPSDDRWLRLLDLDFRKVAVNRLGEEDARRIVRAWKEAGSLGDFASVREDARAAMLLAYAREEGDRYRHKEPTSGQEESSFLGAMLRARKSRTLEGYVGDILDRLSRRSAPGGKSLKEVFAYVVALHADNLPILYRPILGHLLSCKRQEVEDEVIIPLSDEAATDVSGRVVLARHRRIAEVARDILCGKHKRPSEYKAQREAFEHQIYPELAYAAIQKGRTEDGEVSRRDLTPWNDLPSFYARRGQTELAIHIAEALTKAEPEDPMPVIKWANLHRRKQEEEKAVEIFRERYPLISEEKLNKGFFTEWAAAEGARHNHCLDAWLLGIALSDKLRYKHEGDDASMILLSSLTSAFIAIYRKTADECDRRFYSEADAQTFLEAAAAAAQLGLDDRAQEGLRENYDKSESIGYLRKGEALGREKHVPQVEPDEAIDRLIRGIALAWEIRAKDTDSAKMPGELPAANKLNFEELRRVFGAVGAVGTKPEVIIRPLTRRPRRLP